MPRSTPPARTLKTAQSPKPPRRLPNAIRRPREHLTEAEVKRLVTAAGSAGRYPWRDAALVTVMFRHALRVGEVVALRWDMVDLSAALLHVRRAKNGTPSTHPMHGPTLRLLRAWKRQQEDRFAAPAYVFTSERGAPLTAAAVRRIVARAGVEAGFAMPLHPHMLRHSCGFTLARKGIDTRAIQLYLGHRNIQNTVIYTALSPDRFRVFWSD